MTIDNYISGAELKPFFSHTLSFLSTFIIIICIELHFLKKYLFFNLIYFDFFILGILHFRECIRHPDWLLICFLSHVCSLQIQSEFLSQIYWEGGRLTELQPNSSTLLTIVQHLSDSVESLKEVENVKEAVALCHSQETWISPSQKLVLWTLFIMCLMQNCMPVS